MAVQRQAGLEAQRIAGAEPDRPGAVFDQPVVDAQRVVALDEQFEADRLAGVTGTGDEHPRAADVDDTEFVAHRVGQVALGDRLHDLARARALQAEHRDVDGAVAHLAVREAGAQRLQVRPVLLAVGRVDHQQVLVLDETVQVGVVDHAARPVRDHRVLAEADVQRRRVVAQGVLQEGQGVRAADDETPHVRDVEQPGALAGRQVLLQDALELQRHLPAAELDQLGARRHVARVEHRAQCFAHRPLPVS